MKGKLIGLMTLGLAFGRAHATVLNNTEFDLNPTFTVGPLGTQNGWNSVGDYSVTNAIFHGNTQSLTIDSSAVNSSWAFKPLASAPNYLNSGNILTTVWVRYDDVTPGDLSDNSAAGLDAWTSEGSEHFATLMVHPSRGGVLKAGFDDQAVSNSSISLARNTWIELMLVCRPAARKSRGYVNSVDVAGVLTNSSTTAANISDVDLACYAFGPYPELFGVSPNGGMNNIWWDSYRVDLVNDGTVRGKVSLQDLVGSSNGRSVTVKLLNSAGSVVETQNGVLDGAGVFFVSFFNRGPNMSVIVKASHWLGRKISIGTLEDIGVYNANVTLVNGDVDGDNEVGLSDFGLLSNSFGSFAGDPNYLVNADLDGEGEVGLSDFGILSARFGQLGD